MKNPIFKPVSIQDWIDTLPPDARDYYLFRAQEYYSGMAEGITELKVNSLHEALKGAFIWEGMDKYEVHELLYRLSNKAPIKFFQFN